MTAPSNAPSICHPHASDAMHGRTDGRTYADASSPRADTSSSVTRALAYGDPPFPQTQSNHQEGIVTTKPEVDLTPLLDLIASAVLAKGPIRQGPVHVERDPRWKRHRAEARAASIGRDLCTYRGCLRPCGEPDEPWCWRHSPDEVAIQRAMAGGRVDLLTHERHEAARRLLATGMPHEAIADRLNISRRHVERMSADTRTERTAA